jgi:hypothetical protein
MATSGMNDRMSAFLDPASALAAAVDWASLPDALGSPHGC